MKTGPKPIDPSLRFMEKVDVRAGCWIWTGALQPNGYGRFWDGSRSVLVHRWSYEHHIGPIPEGHEVDHVRARGCLSRACVNPAHLEAVTRLENQLRGDTMIAAQVAQTECVHGHEFTEANTYRWRGQRKCKTCQRERRRAYVDRRREALC